MTFSFTAGGGGAKTREEEALGLSLCSLSPGGAASLTGKRTPRKRETQKRKKETKEAKKRQRERDDTF